MARRWLLYCPQCLTVSVLPPYARVIPRHNDEPRYVKDDDGEPLNCRVRVGYDRNPCAGFLEPLAEIAALDD